MQIWSLRRMPLSAKQAEPMSPERLGEVGTALSRLYDALPEGWVFGGVMLQADFEYNDHVDRAGAWVAVATEVGSKALGPIPEAHGYGNDMVGAIDGLRLSFSDVAD